MHGNNPDAAVNTMLEKIAQGYLNAASDWKKDQKNLFKDGKLLAYYEAKETLAGCIDSEDALSGAFDAIDKKYAAAKTDWLADKKNPFKDGRMLGYFEVVKTLPSLA